MKPEDLDPRLILDETPAFLFSGRPDGDIDYVNRRFLDEVGAPLEAIQGGGWMKFIHPDDLEEHLRIWQASLASGDPAIHEARVRRADGEYRWMLFRTLPMRD
ncbi:MAG TPA: PAS domain-containing protein, partial [Thermoanaerobaculia bacterium]|nr:PAS domain-containing protein [Thermoanaerobaculia bacterium]